MMAGDGDEFVLCVCALTMDSRESYTIEACGSLALSRGWMDWRSSGLRGKWRSRRQSDSAGVHSSFAELRGRRGELKVEMMARMSPSYAAAGEVCMLLLCTVRYATRSISSPAFSSLTTRMGWVDLHKS